MTLLLALLACSPRPAEAPAPADAPPAAPADEAVPAAASSSPSACVTWTSEPVALSEQGDEPRHHATVAWSSTGLLAAWQVGKDPAHIAVRAFDASLVPGGTEQRVSGTDARATHPQIAAGGDRASLLWTREDDGALRWVAVGPDGTPQSDPSTLAVEPGAPQRYGDLAYGPDGQALALRLADRGGKPTWPVLTVPEGPKVTPAPRPGTNAGGPGTLRFAPDGTPWGTWAELAVVDDGEDQATLRLLSLAGEGAPAFDLATLPDNLQRTALAFAGGHAVIGWTRYATRTKGWGVGLGVFGLDGTTITPPATVGGPGARMLDLDAAGDVVVAGWEAPHLGQDRELWIQVFDAAGQPRCAAEVAHPPHADDDSRAQVLMREREGVIEGVIVWQRGPHARRQQVWARPFTVAR